MRNQNGLDWKALQWSCFFLFALLLNSCSVFEKASTHGFASGYYNLHPDPGRNQRVYLDIDEGEIAVYPLTDDGTLEDTPFLSLSLSSTESMGTPSLLFSKNSLDVDITSALFKYRFSRYGQPGQLTTDFNASLYFGWRKDYFRIRSSLDPLKKWRHQVLPRGFDFGFFAGPGTASVGPFSTQNIIADDYSGMTLQLGIAGFLESNIASFGIAAGFDHLLNRDRRVWIYQNKPWLGLIVGVALN